MYRSFKFPGKKTATLGVVALTGLTFQATTSDFPEKVRTGIQGIVRSSRAVSTIAVTVVDYKISLRGVTVNTEDYRRKLSEVHVRSAKRILKLCEDNKGFYVKAGQFVGALRQVPKEYTSTLSSLQDQAVPYHFKAIKEALINNLGKDLSQLFLSFDEQPIAAASIAQVHRAMLKDHQEVAIKVQYPGLINQMKLDTTTMSILSESVAWFFPEYRFNWLVTEFAGAMSLELDFILEARNCERTAKNFENNSTVKVPQIFWDFTTSQVLTMEFCAGHKVDDVEFLKEMRINPTKVAKALLEVFAEMIFIHGFLHGDPHPGNILVSPGGQNGFSLVLLDHGIYRQLDEEFRVDYCELWKALIYLDSNKIQHLGDKFGVGKYSKYFPLIFTGRTIDSKSALGGEMPVEERTNLKKELKSLKMEDISSFMESLPPDFLAILRTDGLLRSTVSKLGAPQRVRLLAYAKYALRGLSPKSSYEIKNPVKIMYSRFIADVGYLQLMLALEVLEVVSWMEKSAQLLLARLKQLVISAAQSLVRIRFSVLPQTLN